MKQTMYNTSMRSLLALCGLAFAGHAAAQIQTNTRISSPIIVADKAKMTAGALASSQLDASMSTFTVQGHRYWITSQWKYWVKTVNGQPVYGSDGQPEYEGEITHSTHEGSLLDPYAQTHWTKSTCNRNAQNFCVDGAGTAFTAFNAVDNNVVNLWFVNLYQPQPVDDGELLAFVHEENAGGTGGTQADPFGRTRIGLAWSVDHGNTWKYLGRILIPAGDPTNFNIHGAPYVVKDGYVHVYYTDVSSNGHIVAVARASVADVLQAARAGNVGNGLWMKHLNGQFNSAGLGGNASAMTPGLWGISHTQAAYSTLTGKYYLPLTFMAWPDGNGGRVNTSVKLYESTDALNWNASPAYVVADERADTVREDGGYQYCSIVDRDGGVNAVVSRVMHVYCMKDPTLRSANFGLYRWDVNLAQSINTFRQSYDFTTTPNTYWRYRSIVGATAADMTSQTTHWSGADPYALIYADAEHPGTTELPLLEWKAPLAGTVRIEGTARSAHPLVNPGGAPGCGDGVDVSVRHNGIEIFATNLAMADTVGKSIDRTVGVAVNDVIGFVVKPRSNNYCDLTRFDPSITYQ